MIPHHLPNHDQLHVIPTRLYSVVSVIKDHHHHRHPTASLALLTSTLQHKLHVARNLETTPIGWERETGLQIGGAFSEGSFTLTLTDMPSSVTVSETAEEIGTRVWDSAILMSRWFEKMTKESQFMKGKRVIELGSGTGLLGLVCARLGAKLVVLTDLPVLLPTMQANIERNELQGNVIARALNWNDAAGIRALVREFGTFDFVVASDVLVFAGDARKPFLHTTTSLNPNLVEHTGLLYTICAFSHPTQTSILMGCGLNRQGFLDGFYNNPPTDLFDIEMVKSDEMHPDFQTKRIILYRMKVLEETHVLGL